MAEAKNNFLKAKMNQDLDDRLLPNGEYRNAQNILVGKSEEDSVGTLENIKGNELIASTTIADGVYGKMYIIGYLMDSSKDRIYTFLTDWNGIEEAPVDASCSIRFLNVNDTTQYQTLVSGSFLNFSTQNPIIAVNLLEDLLFFTDNRNQPRKINVDIAESDANHYYEENHISIAKYNPYQPISLVKEEVGSVTGVTSATVFEIAPNSNIVAGMTVLGTTTAGVPTMQPTEYIKVVSAVSTATETTVTIDTAPATAISLTDVIYFLASTMTNESSISTWPGDPDYLQDKFVRFAYRFKFEDNEYSIFSPFTQIAYIPKQNGYFINGNEKSAFNSTIVDWFENGIDNIELIVPLPDKANNIVSSYKISSIDILYRESDQISVKVLDTVLANEISGSSQDNTFYTYSYQSRKPIRTLPQDQTVRVYDKVPVKAKTQEIISNRVVYGNFQTKHTPPASVNYAVSIEQKIANPQYNSFIEYPNHTIKQNRNYQIGFVLSDKFGRQSDVILSPVSDFTVGTSRGSTIYAPYINDDPTGSDIPDPTYMPSGTKDWFGNSIIVLVNSAITQSKDNLSPGLYAAEIDAGFDVEKSTTPVITDTTYTFEISTEPTAATAIPVKDSYMRGAYVDYVKVTEFVTGTGTSTDPYVVTTDGRVNDMYLADNTLAVSEADVKFAYYKNTLGWYSYKIVVKQNEQEYYNVYTAGAMKDVPLDYNVSPDPEPPDASNTVNPSTSFITLINDNINKVPRDLSEVGPQDKTFRSSVRLFGRVENTTNVFSNTGNAQYYPGNRNFTTNTIEDLFDLFDVGTVTQGNTGIPITDPKNPYHGFFKSESNPFIAEFITSNIPSEQFGIFNEKISDEYQDIENLTIFETEPVVSALDIYWETTQAGLISDLNWDVAVGFDGPVSINPTFSFEETDAIDTDLTQDFFPLNSLGNGISTTTPGGFTVTSPRGDETIKFNLIQNPDGSYKITNDIGYAFNHDSFTQDVFTFDITFNEGGSGSTWGTQTLSFTGRLQNNEPSFTIKTPNPYYFYDETYIAGQVIHDFGVQTDGSGEFTSVNGAGIDSTKQTDLQWTILTGNEAGYFSIEATSGKLKLTTAGLASGNNSYPITIRLADASLLGATPGAGSLHDDQNITVIRGYPQSDSYVSSIANKDWSSQSADKTSGCPSGNTSTFDYICCYMSDASIADNDLPNYDNSGDFQATENPQPCSPSPIGNPRNAYRIGDSQSVGEFVFGIEEAKVTYFEGFCIPQPSFATLIQSIITMRVYHTTATNPTSSDWTRIADINGLDGTVNTFDYIKLNPSYYDGAANGSSPESSVYFAGNTPGKYAFSIKIENITLCANGGASTFNTTLSTRLRDLHYITTAQTQSTSPFRIFNNSGNGYISQSNICSVQDFSNDSVHADNPFPEYVREFYDASDLVNVYTPPTPDRFYPAVRTPITNQSIGAAPKLNADGLKDETISAPYAAIILGSPLGGGSTGTCNSLNYAAPRFDKLFP